METFYFYIVPSNIVNLEHSSLQIKRVIFSSVKNDRQRPHLVKNTVLNLISFFLSQVSN